MHLGHDALLTPFREQQNRTFATARWKRSADAFKAFHVTLWATHTQTNGMTCFLSKELWVWKPVPKIQAEEKKEWEDKDYLYFYEDIVMTWKVSIGSTVF